MNVLYVAEPEKRDPAMRTHDYHLKVHFVSTSSMGKEEPENPPTPRRRSRACAGRWPQHPSEDYFAFATPGRGGDGTSAQVGLRTAHAHHGAARPMVDPKTRAT